MGNEAWEIVPIRNNNRVIVQSYKLANYVNVILVDQGQ